MPRQTRKLAATNAAESKSSTEEPSSDCRAMIIPKCLLNEDGNARIVKLKNPKTGDGEMYCFDCKDENVFQMMKFHEQPSSWFVDDVVIQDGSITYVTEIDPLFLVLPYLKEAIKFQPLENILVDAAFPECRRLLSVKGLRYVEQVADVKESGQIMAYCYNSDKCMHWLSRKVTTLAERLKTTKMHVASGSKAATFVTKDVTATADYTKFAHGMISEYLSADVSKSLLNYLGIVPTELEKVPDSSDSPPAKRSKVGEGPLEDYSSGFNSSKKSSQPKKLTAAQKSLSKVDKSSMKTISSFFGRKKN